MIKYEIIKKAKKINDFFMYKKILFLFLLLTYSTFLHHEEYFLKGYKTRIHIL